VHGEETDNTIIIESEGAQLMCEEETKGGASINLREFDLCKEEIE